MWSDEIDKKIKEAAENDPHHYEEASWQKMEPLLDKHLPQEKKRRRFIFFLFTFLLLGSAGIFIITKTSTGNKKITEQKANQESITVPAGTNSQIEKIKNNPEPIAEPKENIIVKEKTISSNGDVVKYQEKNQVGDILKKEKSTTGKESLILQNAPVNKKTNSSLIPATTILTAASDKKNKNINTPTEKEITQLNNESAEKEENKSAVRQDDASLKSITDKPLSVISPPVNENTIKKEEEKIITQESKEPEINSTVNAEKVISREKKENADSAIASASAKTKTQKSARQKGNKLIISFSAGPDISAVGTKPGNWKMQYGIGIGYAIADRFTIRTGFYMGRKIYSADSTNYHTPFNTVNYYYKLEKVDANCLVYEIPLTVTYSFSKSKRHDWFVSTGLSSYLMNKEDYSCTYKSQWGTQEKHDYSYDNKNFHLFSVFNFSGGYQHHFNDRLSFMAEPYIKLPLTGIGFGKVNLNSAGVLFTVGYKPFLRSKPKTVVVPTSDNP